MAQNGVYVAYMRYTISRTFFLHLQWLIIFYNSTRNIHTDSSVPIIALIDGKRLLLTFLVLFPKSILHSSWNFEKSLKLYDTIMEGFGC